MFNNNALSPTAVFKVPVVFDVKAAVPIAILYEAVVLASKAKPPTAMFLAPVVFTFNASLPIAIL